MIKNSIFLVLICAVSQSLIWAQEEVRGANVLLEIQPSARNGGLGGVRSGHNANLGNLGFDPAGLNELDGRSLELSHSEEFGGANFDWIALAIPLDSTQGNLAFQFGRYAVDDIYRTREGEIYTGNDIPTFSISEYFLSGFWAKEILTWDLGVGVHGIYRQLDQDGWGVRVDASLAKTFWDELRIGLVWEGLTSSATQWESGYLEYAPPEFYPIMSWQKDLPFFYGVLNLYWQGAGLVHERANRLNSYGRSGWNQDMHTWLGGSQLGAEFEVQKGLLLRTGLQNADDLQTWSVGAGIPFFHKFQVDYSMEAHPELDRVHRLSLSWFIDAKKPQAAYKEVQIESSNQVKSDEPQESLSSESKSDSQIKTEFVEGSKSTQGEPPEYEGESPERADEFLEDDDEILEDDEEVLE